MAIDGWSSTLINHRFPRLFCGFAGYEQAFSIDFSPVALYKAPLSPFADSELSPDVHQITLASKFKDIVCEL
jgi:hypothetical protein